MATPAYGWYFDHWAGSVSGNSASNYFLLNSNMTVTGVFLPIPLYSVTVGTAGGGTVQVGAGSNQWSGLTVNQTLFSNTMLTMGATPDPGWTFLYWTNGLAGTINPLQAILNANLGASAVFGTTLATNTIGSGTVQVDPLLQNYPFGTATHLMGVLGAGQFFRYWTNTPLGTLSNSPVRYVVTNGAPSFTAVFGNLPPQRYSLTVLVSGDGEVSESPQALFFTNGQVVGLTATPNAGASFVGWAGDTNGAALAGNALTLTMNPSKVVTARFQAGLGLPRLQAVAKAGNTLTFTWSATAGRAYQVQYKTNLTEPNWLNLGSPITGTGGTATAFDLMTNAQRFYRVELLP